MKVFISWSGDRSKRVAELVDNWLQCTIQTSQPWLSSRSIDRGALWFSEITAELADTTIGVICLTAENKEKPWILFEAGALAKGLNSNRVCTFLIDISPADLENPLAQFNHTIYSKESLQQLLNTINSLSETPLKPNILEKVFEKYWPEFQENFDEIINTVPVVQEEIKRDEIDILSEILNTTRGLDKRIAAIENKGSSTSISQDSIAYQRSIDQIARMIINGQSILEIKGYASAKWGYSGAVLEKAIIHARDFVTRQEQRLENGTDMLQQLKDKFGKS